MSTATSRPSLGLLQLLEESTGISPSSPYYIRARSSSYPINSNNNNHNHNGSQKNSLNGQPKDWSPSLINGYNDFYSEAEIMRIIEQELAELESEDELYNQQPTTNTNDLNYKYNTLGKSPQKSNGIESPGEQKDDNNINSKVHQRNSSVDTNGPSLKEEHSGPPSDLQNQNIEKNKQIKIKNDMAADQFTNEFDEWENKMEREIIHNEQRNRTENEFNIEYDKWKKDISLWMNQAMEAVGEHDVDNNNINDNNNNNKNIQNDQRDKKEIPLIPHRDLTEWRQTFNQSMDKEIELLKTNSSQLHRTLYAKLKELQTTFASTKNSRMRDVRFSRELTKMSYLLEPSVSSSNQHPHHHPHHHNLNSSINTSNNTTINSSTNSSSNRAKRESMNIHALNSLNIQLPINNTTNSSSMNNMSNSNSSSSSIMNGSGMNNNSASMNTTPQHRSRRDSKRDGINFNSLSGLNLGPSNNNPTTTTTTSTSNNSSNNNHSHHSHTHPHPHNSTPSNNPNNYTTKSARNSLPISKSTSNTNIGNGNMNNTATNSNTASSGWGSDTTYSDQSEQEDVYYSCNEEDSDTSSDREIYRTNSNSSGGGKSTNSNSSSSVNNTPGGKSRSARSSSVLGKKYKQ